MLRTPCERGFKARESALAELKLNRLLGNQHMTATYLTTEQLSARIHYDVRTIRNCLKDSVLLEGQHYIRPFGRRKLLFIWEAIAADLERTAISPIEIPMAAGGVCRG